MDLIDVNDVNRLSTIFKALSDPSRLRILTLLANTGELCVCDIEAVMGWTQTKVSRHLGYLKRAGLVRDRKQGLWVHYSVAASPGTRQRTVLDQLRHLFETDPAARKDAERLEALRDRGCCVAEQSHSRKGARRGK